MTKQKKTSAFAQNRERMAEAEGWGEIELLECRLLAEQCAALLKQAPSDADLYEVLAPVLSDMDITPSFKTAMPDQRPLLHAQAQTKNNMHRAALSLFLAQALKRQARFLAPWYETPPDRNRICYVPSLKSETAFRCLAEQASDVTLLYAESAEKALAATDTGRADYCLLPFETADGNRIAGIAKAAQALDMHLTAVVRVPTDENEDSCLFALYGKRHVSFCTGEETRIEFTLRDENAFSATADMAQAVRLFGFRVERFSCQPNAYGRPVANFVLCEDGDILAFWLYACLFTSGFVLSGIYPVLSA